MRGADERLLASLISSRRMLGDPVGTTSFVIDLPMALCLIDELNSDRVISLGEGLSSSSSVRSIISGFLASNDAGNWVSGGFEVAAGVSVRSETRLLSLSGLRI